MKSNKLTNIIVIIFSVSLFSKKCFSQVLTDEIHLESGITFYAQYKQGRVKTKGSQEIELRCPEQEDIITGYAVVSPTLSSPQTITQVSGKRITIINDYDTPDWSLDLSDSSYHLIVRPIYSIEDSLFKTNSPKVESFKLYLKLKRNEFPKTNYSGGFVRTFRGSPGNSNLQLSITKGTDNNPPLIGDDNFNGSRFSNSNNTVFILNEELGSLTFDYNGAVSDNLDPFQTSLTYFDWENKSVTVPIKIVLKPDNSIPLELDDITISEEFIEGEEGTFSKLHGFDPVSKSPAEVEFIDDTDISIEENFKMKWTPDYKTVPADNSSSQVKFKIRTASNDREKQEAWLFATVLNATSPKSKKMIDSAITVFQSKDLQFRKNVSCDACILAYAVALLQKNSNQDEARTEILSQVGSFGIDETVLKVAELINKWVANRNTKKLESVKGISTAWSSKIDLLLKDNESIYKRVIEISGKRFVKEEEAKKLLIDAKNLERKIQNWEISSTVQESLIYTKNSVEENNEIIRICTERSSRIR